MNIKKQFPEINRRSFFGRLGSRAGRNAGCSRASGPIANDRAVRSTRRSRDATGWLRRLDYADRAVLRSNPYLHAAQSESQRMELEDRWPTRDATEVDHGGFEEVPAIRI